MNWTRLMLCILVGLAATACTAKSGNARRSARTASPQSRPAATAAACRYVFPVQPASSTRYGRYHHGYPATDIYAPRGTRVVSPVDGVVDWVSPTDLWDPKVDDPATRGGRAVAIIGQDGVRYYGSHLLDVAPALYVGVRVTAGDPIGHVDSSGNARGVSPHLHFGISHPTTPGDWKVRRGEIGPFGYLNAWKTGRALTPVVPGARAPLCSPAR